MGRRPKSPPEDSRIHTLTFEDFVSLLFPNGALDYEIVTPEGNFIKAKWDEFDPPPNWQRGISPKTQKTRLEELDNQISQICDNTEVHARLEDEGVACPYYAVRWGIVVEAHYAANWEKERRDVEIRSKTIIGELIKQCEILKESESVLLSRDILGQFHWPEEHRGLPVSEGYEPLNATYEHDLSEIRLLSRVIEAVERRIEFEKAILGPGRPGWRSILIEGLGKVWHGLTKPRTPVSGKEIALFKFVDAVFRAIEFTPPAPGEVEATVKRVQGLAGKEGRPEWDRFDAPERWQRRVHLQRREWFACNLRLRECHEGKIRNEVDEDLRRAYVNARPSEQAYFRGLGYVPPPLPLLDRCDRILRQLKYEKKDWTKIEKELRLEYGRANRVEQAYLRELVHGFNRHEERWPSRAGLLSFPRFKLNELDYPVSPPPKRDEASE